MTPPVAPPSPVMPAKAGIHDFTIHSQSRGVMTPSLRGRAATEAIQHRTIQAAKRVGIPDKRDSVIVPGVLIRIAGLLRRGACPGLRAGDPRNDYVSWPKPTLHGITNVGPSGLFALACLFLFASSGVSAAVELGTYQLQGTLLLPASVSEFGVAYFKGSISTRATLTKLNFSFGSTENEKTKTITCSGIYQGSETMVTIPFSCSDGIVGYATETHDRCDPVSGFDGGLIFLEPQGFRGNFFLLGQLSCPHLVN